MIEIKAISQNTGDSYGKRRMLLELLDKGYQLSLYQTAYLIKSSDGQKFGQTLKAINASGEKC